MRMAYFAKNFKALAYDQGVDIAGKVCRALCLAGLSNYAARVRCIRSIPHQVI